MDPKTLIPLILAVTVAASGCISQTTAEQKTNLSAVNFSEKTADNWKKVSTSKNLRTVNTLGINIAEIPISFSRYTDQSFYSTVEAQSLGLINQPVFEVYTVKISTASLPNLLKNVFLTDKAVMDVAEKKVVTQSEKRFNVTLKKSDSFKENNSLVRVYKGNYSYPERSVTVFGKEVLVSGGKLGVESRMYSWGCEESDLRYVLAGFYPAEDFERKVEAEFFGANMSTDISIDFQPDRRRERLSELRNGVGCPDSPN